MRQVSLLSAKSLSDSKHLSITLWSVSFQKLFFFKLQLLFPCGGGRQVGVGEQLARQNLSLSLSAYFLIPEARAFLYLLLTLCLSPHTFCCTLPMILGHFRIPLILVESLLIKFTLKYFTVTCVANSHVTVS